jgi:hypothetical protein
MKIIQLLAFLCFSVFNVLQAQTAWQSELISVDSKGNLTYKQDKNGYVIPNFSHAGYKGGGIELPEVSTMKEISAIPGDNTKQIQDAINYVGSLPKNSDGMRGALLLKAGKYDVFGTIYLKFDGVVLRGEGQGSDPLTSTIIYARGNSPSQRDVILVGSSSQISGISEINGTRSKVTESVVPVGSYTFNVENSSLYKVGDRITIYHPASKAWVEAVDYGGVPYPDPSAPGDPDERWVEGQLPIIYNRYIKSINGNQITIDAPVFYSLNKSISECYIFKPNMNGLVNQVALENLRIDIETLGGTDEAHAWQAARFKSCENSWAKNCTFIHFGQSGIITEACTRSTFTECSAIDPVAIVTGERMYNFNTYQYSQLNLFSNCYARNGRHHYVSNGTSTTSGNVFLRCISDATNSVNEGHRQWTQGMLYDNHKEKNLKRDFVLGLYNRVAMGTGHGWAAAHSVLWNCDVDATYGKIGLQKPPTAQNYAIGCFAKTITGTPISDSNFPVGYVEGKNVPGLEPTSLYEAQLAERKQITSAQQINKKQCKLEIYPTLAEDELNANFHQNISEKSIKIRTITGSVVKTINTTDSFIIIQTSQFANGIYLFECKIDNETFSLKFIKK